MNQDPGNLRDSLYLKGGTYHNNDKFKNSARDEFGNCYCWESFVTEDDEHCSGWFYAGDESGSVKFINNPNVLEGENIPQDGDFAKDCFDKFYQWDWDAGHWEPTTEKYNPDLYPIRDIQVPDSVRSFTYLVLRDALEQKEIERASIQKRIDAQQEILNDLLKIKNKVDVEISDLDETFKNLKR